MPTAVLWGLGNFALLLSAYLLGSIPTGYLLGKALQGIDIREHGSGSIGATNVLRTLGKRAGFTVLVTDILKGVVAVIVAQAFYRPGGALWTQAPPNISVPQWLPWLIILVGLAAILGHSKPVWLKFQGGKSVAVGLGILLMLNWQVGLATVGVFGLVVGASRIVSLGSICGAIALPIWMLVFQQPLAYLLFSLVASSYVILRHRGNLQRLLAGTEPRLGTSSPPQDNIRSA